MKKLYCYCKKQNNFNIKNDNENVKVVLEDISKNI